MTIKRAPLFLFLLLSFALIATSAACDSDSGDPSDVGGGTPDTSVPTDTVSDATTADVWAGDVATADDAEPLDGGGDAADTGLDTGPPPPPDRDDDGVPDDQDRFPDDPCEAFDLDGDGVGDGADPDRDGDGVEDRWERVVGTSPWDPNDAPPDTDSDEDGVPDYRDRFPDDIDRAADFDGDGLDDDEDLDDDDDGIADDDELAAETDPRSVAPVATCVLRHEPGWYAGDLHAHTTYSDGEEDVPTFVALLESYQDPSFLDAHPAFVGRPLHYQALTDHRTIDGILDPGYVSDRLALIAGSEVGGPQHGNALGIYTRIPHDPGPGETYATRVGRAIEQAHWQGGTFQANHPFSPKIMWTTAIENLDAIEVWNVPWALERAATEEELDRKVASVGAEHPVWRPALHRVSTNANGQALAAWENAHVCGIHLALVGGSDRHMLLPPGFPTTWIYARQLAPVDLVDAVRAHRTTISWGPSAPRVEAAVRLSGIEAEYPIGAEIPVSGDSPTVTLRVVLDRGAGTTVQVLAGPVSAEDCATALADFGGPDLLVEHTVPADAPEHYETELNVTPPVPGWMYLRVLQPTHFDDLPAEARARLESAAEELAGGLDDAAADLPMLLLPVVNGLDPAGFDPCTTETWDLDDPLAAHCLTADPDPLYTYLLPEPVMHVLNLWSGDAPEGGQYVLGALSSAFVFTPGSE